MVVLLVTASVWLNLQSMTFSMVHTHLALGHWTLAGSLCSDVKPAAAGEWNGGVAIIDRIHDC